MAKAAAKVRAPKEVPTEWLPISKLVENTWNMNEVTDEEMEEMEKGFLDGVRETGKFPGHITVRIHPKKKGMLEIIDGAHRFLIAQKLGWPKVPVQNMGVISDAMARRWTIALNYKRGTPNEEQYAKVLAEVIKEVGVEKTMAFIPESENELENLLRDYQQDLPGDLFAFTDDLEVAMSDDVEAKRPAKKTATRAWTVQLTPKQFKVVSDALERAGSTGTEASDGEALAVICAAWRGPKKA